MLSGKLSYQVILLEVYPDMAIKMRVLYTPTKKKLADMAAMIKAEYNLEINAVDKILPAYSCNNERIVILMLSLKGEPDDQLRRFCNEMTKARANNTALIINGTEDAAKRMKDILAAAGTKVVDEVFYVKTAFLSFLDKITPEEKEALLAWTHRVVDGLQ